MLSFFLGALLSSFIVLLVRYMQRNYNRKALVGIVVIIAMILQAISILVSIWIHNHPRRFRQLWHGDDRPRQNIGAPAEDLPASDMTG